MSAESVVGGVLGVMDARLLLDAAPRPMAELLNPLMAMIVLPYLGEKAALRELSRTDHAAPAHRVPRTGEELERTTRRRSFETRR